MAVGVNVGRSTLLAIALIVAVFAYVVLPALVKGYSVDPAFSGILTGIIGLASIKPNGSPPKE